MQLKQTNNKNKCTFSWIKDNWLFKIAKTMSLSDIGRGTPWKPSSTDDVPFYNCPVLSFDISWIPSRNKSDWFVNIFQRSMFLHYFNLYQYWKVHLNWNSWLIICHVNWIESQLLLQRIGSEMKAMAYEKPFFKGAKKRCPPPVRESSSIPCFHGKNTPTVPWVIAQTSTSFQSAGREKAKTSGTKCVLVTREGFASSHLLCWLSTV